MTDDWFELLASLLDHDVRFLVVGAHALAVHGVPRGTQDLDVWVAPEPVNAARVWEALEGSYQLSVSYEVTLANIDSIAEAERNALVESGHADYGLMVGS